MYLENVISFFVECLSLLHLSSPPPAACGGELNAPSGTISSPNYPNLYPHSRVCRWELVVPMGRRVTLTINDLRLEGSGTSCAFDYVEVSPFPPTCPCVLSLDLFHFRLFLIRILMFNQDIVDHHRNLICSDLCII